MQPGAGSSTASPQPWSAAGLRPPHAPEAPRPGPGSADCQPPRHPGGSVHRLRAPSLSAPPLPLRLHAQTWPPAGVPQTPAVEPALEREPGPWDGPQALHTQTSPGQRPWPCTQPSRCQGSRGQEAREHWPGDRHRPLPSPQHQHSSPAASAVPPQSHRPACPEPREEQGTEPALPPPGAPGTAASTGTCNLNSWVSSPLPPARCSSFTRPLRLLGPRGTPGTANVAKGSALLLPPRSSQRPRGVLTSGGGHEPPFKQ